MVEHKSDSNVIPSDDDIRKVRDILPLWSATRLWAEQLLCSSLSLESIKDLLSDAHRGRKKLPGTTWYYRTHGVGVDIDRGLASGGIDFDLDKAAPDPWRLHLFLCKQLNAGNLDAAEYWELADDEPRFLRAAERALADLGEK